MKLKIFFVAAIFVVLISVALAHDPNAPQLDAWYKSLYSDQGSCCSGSDATTVHDADWEVKAGHYRVFIWGAWQDVPDKSVVKGPNLSGKTLVWPLKGIQGVTIRCFMPGQMT